MRNRQTDGEQRTLSVVEFALSRGYCHKRIRDFLYERRIQGAVKVDGVWRIPANATILPSKRRQQISFEGENGNGATL